MCAFLTVQHECIPQAILGMDVLCQAKSGMGKTAVFVLATLQQLEPVTGQVIHGSSYLDNSPVVEGVISTRDGGGNPRQKIYFCLLPTFRLEKRGLLIVIVCSQQ